MNTNVTNPTSAPVPVTVVSGGTGGGATAANQATQITAEQAILATAGATSGAAVITDANGTIQQYLRGIVKLAITAGGWLVTLPSGSQTSTWSAVTASGSVTAGGTSITFLTSSDWDGTIAGTAFPASATMSFDATPGKTLAAIAYVRTAGTLYIAKVV